VRSFLAHYWWLLIFSAVLAVWIRHLARRARDLNRPTDTVLPKPAAPSGAHPAVFRRAEFQARSDAVTRGYTRGFLLALVVMVVQAPLWIAVRALFDLPRGMFAYGITAGVFLGAVLLIGFAFRAGRVARRLGLVCPHCGIDFFRTNEPGQRYQDLVLETGACPGCRAPLLDASEVGPVSTTLTKREHAQLIGVLVLMTVAIVVMTYYGSRMAAETRALRCRNRYAAARTAADSVTVDARAANKSGSIRCGDLRREGRLKVER
jgi:hypothetical protein